MTRKEGRRLEKLKKAKKRKRFIRSFSLIIIVLTIVYVKTSWKNNSGEEQNKLSQETTNQEEYQITILETENQTADEETNVENETTIINQLQYYISNNLGKEDDDVKLIVEKYITSKNLNSDNFSFFYYSPSQNTYYFYNEDKFFTAASTTKVPVAMLYYEKINDGEISLTDTLEYKAENYEAGGGTTNLIYNVGDYIEISFLLEQMIVNSDNTAWKILMDGLGGDSVTRQMITKYTSVEVPSNFIEENLISARFGLDIMRIIYNNQSYYSELIKYMEQSSDGGYLKKNISCDVAHKYGSYKGYIHDYGIVFADEPYLIGVYTNEMENAEDFIAEINESILELQN